jgi:hypothetical protein
MKTYKYEKILSGIVYKIPEIERHNVNTVNIFTEYRDTFTSFIMAFILLMVLVVSSIPATVTVKADNSILSTSATVDLHIGEIEP